MDLYFTRGNVLEEKGFSYFLSFYEVFIFIPEFFL